MGVFPSDVLREKLSFPIQSKAFFPKITKQTPEQEKPINKSS